MTPAAAALEYAKVRAAKYWTEKSHPEYPTIDRPTVITLLAEAFAAGYLRAYADEDKDNDSRVLRYPEPEL